MSHTTITRVVNGRDVLDYVLDEKGHNNNAVRNQLVVPVNMAPGDKLDYLAQMDVHWQQRSAKAVYDMNHIILSFSRKELDPDDPNSILIAAQIMQEFNQKMYAGHQAVIAVQTDGKAGLVHVHDAVSCTNMFTHKGVTNQQTWDATIRREMDAIISKYMEIDYGTPGGEKNKQATMAKRERGEYVWKDDLAQRIRDAQAEAADLDDFLKKLEERHVTGVKKSSKKYGDYITYELTDRSKFGKKDKQPNHALSLRSYNLEKQYQGTEYEGDFGQHMKFGQAGYSSSGYSYSATDTSYTPYTPVSDTPAAATVEEPEEDAEAKAKRQEQAELFADWMAENGREYNADTFLDDMDDFKNDAAFHARIKAEKEAKAAAEAEAQKAAASQEDAAAAVGPVVHQVQTPDDEEERRERAAALKREAEEQRKRDAAQFAEDAPDDLPQAIAEALQKSQGLEQTAYRPDDEDYYS